MRPPTKVMLLLRTLAFLSILFVSVTVVYGEYQYNICLDNGNYTANDAFQSNLDYLLDSIATTNSSTLNDDGLFNASAGLPQSSDIVEVMGYCRADQTPDDCRSCLNNSAYQIRQACPLYKQAVLFLDECTLKYSNGSTYSMVLDDSNVLCPYNPTNVSNWDTFVVELKQLLDGLSSEAASGGPLQKYAQGTGTANLYTLFAMVQCSPDLSTQQCNDCLVYATQNLPQGKIGARCGSPSCQVRYENFRFFNSVVVPPSPPPEPPATTPPSPVQSRTSTSKTKWLGIAASCAAAVLVVGVIIFLIVRRKNLPGIGLINEDAEEITMEESLQFDLELILEATENFSDAKKLGRGGFGSVYLGTLPNGQAIAVKRLSQNSGQGELEFKNEVVLLARLQHRNLVRLLGFCLEGGERLLVYEFVPNSSLDHFIFDPIKRACLDWDTRYKITMGIARGLLYLHEDSRLRIIHRDLKASNILLDADMSPKVSDFGMARLFELDQTQADTKRIVGTYGYMAPEYVLHGHFSLKSDVFSFGVLVLEIVSGRKNNDRTGHSGGDPEILISHVWRSWREGKISDIVDPLMSQGHSTNILRCIHIGLLCVQENMSSRPTMASVIVMLNSDSVSLPMPTQPAFLMSSGYVSEISSSVDGTSSVDTHTTSAASQVDHSGNRISEGPITRSVNGLSVTEPYPR